MTDRKTPMVIALREKILLTGTTKINKEYTQTEQPTRRKKILPRPHLLKPANENHQSHNPSVTFSDHAMVEVIKAAKKVKTSQKYLKIRSMKFFHNATFVEPIMNHEKIHRNHTHHGTQTLSQQT